MSSCEKEFTFDDLCKKWNIEIYNTIGNKGRAEIFNQRQDYTLDIYEDGEVRLYTEDNYVSITDIGTSFNRINYILNALIGE